MNQKCNGVCGKVYDDEELVVVQGLTAVIGLPVCALCAALPLIYAHLAKSMLGISYIERIGKLEFLLKDAHLSIAALGVTDYLAEDENNNLV